MQANNNNDQQPKSKPQGFTIRIDYRLLSIVFALIIIGILIAWKPWAAHGAIATRKITINGEATIKAEPDEYIFNPTYRSTTSDSTKAVAELADKSKSIITKLKELGVSEEKIESSTSTYDQLEMYPKPSGDNIAKATLMLTITVNDKTLTQKVQDFLLTTNPTGQISPQAQFSTDKRKKLEDEARSKATDDAKAKANKQASQLNVKLGKVIEVQDGSGFGVVVPLSSQSVASDGSTTSLPVMPGQNDFPFSVTVTYELK